MFLCSGGHPRALRGALGGANTHAARVGRNLRAARVALPANRRPGPSKLMLGYVYIAGSSLFPAESTGQQQ